MLRHAIAHAAFARLVPRIAPGCSQRWGANLPAGNRGSAPEEDMEEVRGKYVSPAIDQLAFNCPHCDALARQFWFSVHADPLKIGWEARRSDGGDSQDIDVWRHRGGRAWAQADVGRADGQWPPISWSASRVQEPGCSERFDLLLFSLQRDVSLGVRSAGLA